MGSATDDEVELVLRAQRADQAAFAELVGRYRKVLWGVCLRITSNPADAEDALQDALIAAWRHLDGFRADARFSTWIYRIAANAALAIVRRRRETVELAFDVEESAPSFTVGLAERDRIGRALRTLPETFREALVLREYGGLSYAEIAEHQGILVETVKTRLNRARAMMRSELLATS
jgi:RNA polymerase sigma-70 factor (ECF subfamily)